ncbi:hypothetical protein OAV62_01610 [bacterium]|nr:hypothetical protein [bacterium]
MGKRGKYKHPKHRGTNPNKQNKKKVSLADRPAVVRKKKKVHETMYADKDGGETAYAFITSVLGNMRFRVIGMKDGKTYQGKSHIKRRVKSLSKGSNRLEVSNLVLISFRDFEDYDKSNKVDIIYKYYPEEIAYMIRTNELPRDYNKSIGGAVVQDDIDCGFVFGDENVVEPDVRRNGTEHMTPKWTPHDDDEEDSSPIEICESDINDI